MPAPRPSTDVHITIGRIEVRAVARGRGAAGQEPRLPGAPSLAGLPPRRQGWPGMSNSLAIAAVTATLRNLLFAPSSPWSPGRAVTVKPPTWPGRP